MVSSNTKLDFNTVFHILFENPYIIMLGLEQLTYNFQFFEHLKLLIVWFYSTISQTTRRVQVACLVGCNNYLELYGSGFRYDLDLPTFRWTKYFIYLYSSSLLKRLFLLLISSVVEITSFSAVVCKHEPLQH